MGDTRRTRDARVRGGAIIAAAALLTGCAYVGRVSAPAPSATSGAMGSASTSTDGRYVAYSTDAETASPDADHGVYVLDTTAGTRELVSVATDGAIGDDWSSNPAISGDGRYVAFESDADNLVAGDTNDATDVFVRDRVARTTTRVSLGPKGLEADASSYDASISSDGRYVAFTSDSDDLDPTDSNGFGDVFVRDRQTATTKLVSYSGAYGQTDFGASQGAISGNGLFVAFVTDTPLVANDLNDSDDVYVRNLVASTTNWASRPKAGFPDGGGGDSPAISADGRKVAFVSAATDLDTVANDVNGPDVFLRDLAASTTTRISVGPTGGALSAPAVSPSISADGQRVAFASSANASGTDVNGSVFDVFVRDRSNGRTVLVSTNADLVQSASDASAPRLSPDGRYAFWMSQGAYVKEDANGVADVYQRAVDVPRVTAASPATAARGTTVTITLTGSSFLPGATIIAPSGVTVSNTTVVGDASITATFAVGASAPTGPQTVFVQNVGTGPGPLTGALGQCQGCLRIT
jgi:Tol biopolymer transport system component